MATWAEMPRSPGHAFYDRLQDLLREAGFDAFVEGVRFPTKPATHSIRKPATDFDLKPAGIPI